jgi:protein TonB
MRRDLIIGVVVAFAIIGGTAGIGEWLKPHAQKAAPQAKEIVLQLKMPPIPPDEPDVKEPEDIPTPVADFAPPMLNDVPQVVQIDSFVQKMEPPPPEGLHPVTGVINIPQGRLAAGSGMGQIFDLSQLDQIPQAKVQGRPLYPFEMRRAGITGSVTVEFIVEKTGAVRDAFAVKSTQREFEPEAIKAVMRWKFTPGKRQGAAVATHMRVDIVFSLNDE